MTDLTENRLHTWSLLISLMRLSGAEMNAFGKLIFAVIAGLWLACGPALAEKRIALVIGNSAYKNAPILSNPVNDATLVAGMFKSANFDLVTTRLNLNVSEMRKVLREFGARAHDADIAVIYYAGHGIELDGNNYLIPTDASLETDADVLDETLPLDRVLFAAEPAKQLRLIILDACRDNPFAKTMKRTVASRAVGRGLAKVEPNLPNTMIAFAAKAGSTASDGDSKNSPFAAALVDHLTKPGLDLRKAFGYVRDDVLKNTGYKQEPYVYGSLGGEDMPLVPARPAASGPQASPDDPIRKDYELALQLGTRDGWNAFLARYRDGFYADLAKGQLNKITAEDARVAAAERAKLAEQEKARLASENAKKAEIERAAAAAKAAEEARLAAENAKRIEQAKVEAAEQGRVAAEQAAADKLATENAAAETAAVNLPAGKAADNQAAAALKSQETEKIASLPPPADGTLTATAGVDLAKSVLLELRRVGCLAGSFADGEWNSNAQRSMMLFNKYAGTNFDIKIVSIDILDAIKAKPSRICPLICDHGFRADGDQCVKISCRAGYRVNDGNECEKIQEKKPLANRKEDKSIRVLPEHKQAEPAPPKPQASGQVICNQLGCRSVRPGCRLAQASVKGLIGNPSSPGVAEVCN